MYALIAEPDELTSLLIAAVLLDQGFSVLTATTSNCALAAIRKLQPTVIFLDLSMTYQAIPLVDIIHSLSTRHIPMVGTARTALSDKAISQRGLDGFLVKPFHIDVLRNCVKRYLSTNGDSTLLCREV